MSASRSGTLELAVLGLLHETPLHGYELRKRLNSLLGTFRAWGYGSLYPCLKDLLAQGLIAEEPPADDGQVRHPAQPRPGQARQRPGQARPRSGRR
jgi:DNA-binding PadR family transcriptional regulator